VAGQQLCVALVDFAMLSVVVEQQVQNSTHSDVVQHCSMAQIVIVAAAAVAVADATLAHIPIHYDSVAVVASSIVIVVAAMAMYDVHHSLTNEHVLVAVLAAAAAVVVVVMHCSTYSKHHAQVLVFVLLMYCQKSNIDDVAVVAIAYSSETVVAEMQDQLDSELAGMFDHQLLSRQVHETLQMDLC
jgi:hypothetical protein